MSLLPGAANAVLPDHKITGYLLEPSHSPEAAAKAQFFNRFGFAQANWQALKQALLDHVRTNHVVSTRSNGFGDNHVVRGVLASPDGRNPDVDAVWFIDANDPTPRFATAYPYP